MYVSSHIFLLPFPFPLKGLVGVASFLLLALVFYRFSVVAHHAKRVMYDENCGE